LRLNRDAVRIAVMSAPARSWMPSLGPPPPLGDGEVQVWWGALDGPRWWDQLLHLTAPVEQERAARLRRTDDRLRLLAGRALARTLLSACGAGPARGLEFADGPHGKPRLAHGPRGLHFNIAHSGEAVLVALARARHVGVDVEMMRGGFAQDPAGFCSPAEIADLARLDPARREAGFFACWTRKEAYLKARGDGLAVEPDRFDVTVDPDAPPALLATRHDPADAMRWTLAALPPIPGHAAAVAAEGGGWQPHCWRIQGLATAWLAAVE
jgi:4'-phosphopantetheinyl transferase